MVCNPFCCTSIRKGAKRIAVIDIVLFFLTLTVSVGLEWSLFKSVPMRLVLFGGEDDGSSSNGGGLVLNTSASSEITDFGAISMQASNPRESVKGGSHNFHFVDEGKAVWIHVSHFVKRVSEKSTGLGYFVYMSLMVLLMAYFILEVWLCCVLVRAANEKRPAFCTKWLVWRIGLLLITLALTAINLAQMQYTVSDILVQPLNALRLYSIFAVFQLRKRLMRMDPKLVF